MGEQQRDDEQVLPLAPRRKHGTPHARRRGAHLQEGFVLCTRGRALRLLSSCSSGMDKEQANDSELVDTVSTALYCSPPLLSHSHAQLRAEFDMGWAALKLAVLQAWTGEEEEGEAAEEGGLEEDVALAAEGDGDAAEAGNEHDALYEDPPLEVGERAEVGEAAAAAAAEQGAPGAGDTLVRRFELDLPVPPDYSKPGNASDVLNAALAHFKAAMKHLKTAQQFYVLDGYVTKHLAILQVGSQRALPHALL